MPIWQHSDGVKIVLGVGDVGIATAKDHIGRGIIAIGQLAERRPLGPIEAEKGKGFEPKVYVMSVNREGWDNLIGIIKKLRDDMPEEGAEDD